MTREEARNFLNNSKPKDNNAYSIMLNDALDMAIKALEQEPVLDKIRAEIEEFAKNPDFGDLSLGASCGAMKVIEIIDKYRAESEVEDSDNLDSMLEDLWNATESEE